VSSHELFGILGVWIVSTVAALIVADRTEDTEKGYLVGWLIVLYAVVVWAAP
jgi:hypothetical protein